MKSQEQHYLCFEAIYLMTRKYVVYDKEKYNFTVIKTGVLHGSILGPMLFFVCINDFPTTIKLFKFLLYADFTMLLILSTWWTSSN